VGIGRAVGLHVMKCQRDGAGDLGRVPRGEMAVAFDDQVFTGAEGGAKRRRSADA